MEYNLDMLGLNKKNLYFYLYFLLTYIYIFTLKESWLIEIGLSQTLRVHFKK